MRVLPPDCRRHGQQGDYQDDADRPNQHHHAQGDQAEEQQAQRSGRHADHRGELFVEGDGGEFSVQGQHQNQDNSVQCQHHQQIAGRHREDIAEKVAHQVRGVPRAQLHEEDPQRHAHGPQHADRRIVADPHLATEQADADRRQQTEGNDRQQRFDAQPVAQADTAKGGVGDPTADEDDPLDDDETADDATGDTHQHGGQQTIAHELVLQKLEHHSCSLNTRWGWPWAMSSTGHWYTSSSFSRLPSESPW